VPCIVLLAPTASAMRKLLVISEDYARKYNISFNALKSKWLVALPKNCRITFKKVIETRVGSSVSDTRCFVTIFVSMPSRLRRNNVSVLLIMFGHVVDMNLLLFNLLLCTDCTLVVVHFLTERGIGLFC